MCLTGAHSSTRLALHFFGHLWRLPSQPRSIPSSQTWMRVSWKPSYPMLNHPHKPCRTYHPQSCWILSFSVTCHHSCWRFPSPLTHGGTWNWSWNLTCFAKQSLPSFVPCHSQMCSPCLVTLNVFNSWHCFQSTCLCKCCLCAECPSSPIFPVNGSSGNLPDHLPLSSSVVLIKLHSNH